MALLFILFGWAAWVSVAPVPPPVPLEPPAPMPLETISRGVHAAQTVYEYDGVISAYSCDSAPNNPMYPCSAFRDGSQPRPVLHGLVAACPFEHLGDTFTIEGYGPVRCVDTPRTPWINGMIHIDLFMSYPAAVEWGIQHRRVTLD